MKREKLRHYATVLASHADSAWVTPLIFFIFFIDSLILVLPVDVILGTAVSIQPKHLKKWALTGLAGFGLGLGLVTALAASEFQPVLFGWMDHWGYLQKVQDVVADKQQFGYWSLALGVYTVVPCLFAVLAGVLMNLNPWAVWGIAFGAKIMKLVITVWLIFSSSNVFKRWMKWYVKTSV